MGSPLCEPLFFPLAGALADASLCRSDFDFDFIEFLTRNGRWSLISTTHIDYDEFVTQLYKMKSDDSHTLLIFIRAYVGDIKRIVTGEMGLLKEELTTKHDLMHTILQEVHSHLGLGKSGIDATSPDDADPKALSDQECVIAGPKVVKQESVVSGVVQADQTLQAPNLVLTEQVSELEKAIGRLVDVSVELTQKMPISVSLQQGKDGERPCEQGVEAKLDETILARVAGNLVEVQRDQVQRDQVRAAPTDGLCALRLCGNTQEPKIVTLASDSQVAQRQR